MTDESLVSRRSFLAVASTVIPTAASAEVVRADFPSHEPELVQEMVAVSHNNFARVKELVGRQPALAKVSFDWGFGDWETPIDAASHIGNREIAEFLIAHGARPTMFSAAMLGQLDVVKAAIGRANQVRSNENPIVAGLDLADDDEVGIQGVADERDARRTVPHRRQPVLRWRDRSFGLTQIATLTVR